MGNSDELFEEIKPDIDELARLLINTAAELIRKSGTFAPLGAVLSPMGQARLITAVSAGAAVTLVHEALRNAGRAGNVRAVAVCQSTRIVLPDDTEVKESIRVLVEHKRGLCLELFVPYRRRLFGGYKFEPMHLRLAQAEVCLWLDQGVSC